jgi:carbohydrate diacid regulator
MVVTSGQFEHIAQVVTQRAADLLSAHVSVTDERGAIIASSARRSIGSQSSTSDSQDGEILRVPLQLDSRLGQILIAPGPKGEPVSPRLAQALIDLVINEAAVVTRLPNTYELKNKFIHDLLIGSIADEADLIREGHVLGMDFSPPRAVVLIDASDYILRSGGEDGSEPDTTSVQRRAQFVISSVVGFFDLPSDAICGYIGAGELAILKASTTRDLFAWADADSGRERGASWANLEALKRAANALRVRLRKDTGQAVSVGIGRYHPGIRGLSQSYRDAEIALSLGKRLHGDKRVHCLDSLGVAAFVGVADERTKVELAKHLLSPLDRERELLETVVAYFDNDCCPSQTARRLAIHRNTLGYRLEKTRSITGLDPRRFDDAVQLRAALLLRSFDQGSIRAVAQQS